MVFSAVSYPRKTQMDLFFQQGQQVERHHGTLAGSQMAADEVLAHNPANGIVTLELCEPWLDTCQGAGFPTISAIQQLAFVHDDGIA